MNEDRTRDSYPGKSLRILVVEDHGDTLEALSRLLTHFGHEISVADDAQSARKIIDSKEILKNVGTHTDIFCFYLLQMMSDYGDILKIPIKAIILI